VYNIVGSGYIISDSLKEAMIMRNIKCNRLKRIAALILIVVMSLSTFPVYTYAAGNNVSTEAKAALSTASAQKPRLNYEKCNFYVGAKT
jgi:hypothetical protein